MRKLDILAVDFADHGGCISDFPNAMFHIQDAEMRYVSGRCMTYAPLRHAFDEAHVQAMISKLWAGKVVFHGGDPMWSNLKGTGLVSTSGAPLEDEIQPGVSVHTIGGHTGR